MCRGLVTVKTEKYRGGQGGGIGGLRGGLGD